MGIKRAIQRNSQKKARIRKMASRGARRSIARRNKK